MLTVKVGAKDVPVQGGPSTSIRIPEEAKAIIQEAAQKSTLPFNTFVVKAALLLARRTRAAS